MTITVNLAVGFLIVLVVSFISMLSVLTYCVLIKLEKETSEVIQQMDIEMDKIDKESTQHDEHGNPILHSYEDEDFVF
ncbi:hypothetical protein TVAG_372000 [Trichomonas vaginalis G3]|uniref:Uncharacterized protein n=1 Tax=Trichomonas vaginalis (strain ATCC PRA-98 / G3) TaxID=412133 RepID=A2E0X1_TRIV3|nr:hypothetical protein TVAGG3_0326280 [Trichomonas vaginalis G3]EAY13726.1 hypothetical protein TVAG_372000 [Trichomonas vaginalis G3]KAI5529658.1 hypothetical protein TVAGG3_0326280 [Trichomonas vaginalis G3]|eukprot:XP_001325949.1 hypothetical protein [Trichomonas vaginalis G3]